MASDVAWNPSLWSSAGGVVPPDWDLMPFGELLQSPKSIAVGVMYPGEQTTGGVPLVRVGDVGSGGVARRPSMSISRDVHHEYRRTELAGDELLITLVGTPGVCVVARPEMKGWNVARALAVARLKRPELRPYIKAVMESAVMRSIITGMLNTTVQPTLNLKEIKALPLPMPRDVCTAQTLGDFAECFNQRIALLQATNATLEAIAQALFKSWFVDFDPVRAKAEGRDQVGMDPATAALFPSEFDESELGLIPKGWRSESLAGLSELNAAKWTARNHPRRIKYMDLTGVTHNRIESISEYEFDDAPSRARIRLRDGDTIIGTVRPGNRAFAYIHKPEQFLTGSTGFAVLSPKQQHFASFVYLAATRDDAIDRLANLADGGAYPAVRPSVVASTPIVRPPNNVLEAFSALTRPLLERVGESRLTEGTLASLRDNLLPRLISGKLRLPEVAGLTAEVAP